MPRQYVQSQPDQGPLLERTESPRKYAKRLHSGFILTFPKFTEILAQWSSLEDGACVRIPGSHNAISDWEMEYWRRHWFKYAIRFGLFPGTHYGIQRDTKDNCAKVLKLGPEYRQ